MSTLVRKWDALKPAKDGYAWLESLDWFNALAFDVIGVSILFIPRGCAYSHMLRVSSRISLSEVPLVCSSATGPTW